ncbi:integrase [Zhengella mangrovi]|uniref:Integrase n=1 Tax=Zhengella mangrovi TaxID=1982044 RepID=A0A2G1QGV7_9HYPH|nr:phage integrase N-terminal domain-containing protein [Zhengella mangrovi]PHP64701.1 integrase [Zhengella mangrovi]
MDALAYDLKELTTRAGDGSYSTRAIRHRGLQAIARDLRGMGFKLPGAQSLKPKHVTALLGKWKEEGLGDGTLKNRMGWLRWWASSVRKSSVMLPSNEDYGIGQRDRYKGDRSNRLDRERLAKVRDPLVRYSLQLQAAFGMRREEAIKFRVAYADRGEKLVLKPSWTKGGRYREIPVLHPRQRALLDEIREAVGDRALIPDGKLYKDQLSRYKHEVAQSGIGRGHGLRHAYAQWRYKVLTGQDCPAKGGEPAVAMGREDAERDRWAREIIAEELGHGRIDVTDAYLGRRTGGSR